MYVTVRMCLNIKSVLVNEYHRDVSPEIWHQNSRIFVCVWLQSRIVILCILWKVLTKRESRNVSLYM